MMKCKIHKMKLETLHVTYHGKKGHKLFCPKCEGTMMSKIQNVKYLAQVVNT